MIIAPASSFFWTKPEHMLTSARWVLGWYALRMGATGGSPWPGA